ncbi:MAG: DUF1549 and DUF1553 domain-containing protein [Verrucomicrobiota bacterium]
MKKKLLLIVLLGVGFSPAFAAKLTDIRIFPDRVDLNGKRDRQDVVVQAIYTDGQTRDISKKVKLHFDDPEVIRRSGLALRPATDGETLLSVTFEGKTASVPVQVRNADKARDLSFRLDVMPVFLKAGCNTGACHGNSRGQDGFILSLFGYDPEGDYHRLTRELVGRRLDLAVPEHSLVLEKATGKVQHTGGELFDEDSDHYKTLVNWISNYAPNDTEATPHVTGIELLPPKVVVKAAPKPRKQRMVVRATYSDGSVRDVTRLAVYQTNNNSTADIDDDGLVTADKPGGAFVFARFDKFTIGSEVIVLPDSGEFKWPKVDEVNYIDTLVHDKLKKLHMAPSEVASDEQFLRRVTLDLVGLPPTVEEFKAFMDDEDPDKREKLVDRLMARDEFVDLWAMKWGEILMIKSNRNVQYGRDRKAVYNYYQWVRGNVKDNVPVNRFAHQLLTGTGSNLKSPTANFYTSVDQNVDAKKHGENVAQIFLGIQTQCAQCHNHPFDRWTMDDYYGFTSFFAGLGKKSGADPREVIVINRNNNNTVEHPVDGRMVKPRFLGGDAPDVEGKDPRHALADWMTSKDNKLFARNIANRVWAHFFGRGVVEPVDDIRISNPPSNRELFEGLGEKLVAYDFDMKKLIRDICTSRTYQLSATATASNEHDDRFFARSYVRRLQAEVLIDTISQVTETVTSFRGMPRQYRAVQLFEGGQTSDYFLETFGQANRLSVCACEVDKEATLSQTLHLINGDTLSQKFRESRVIYNLMREGGSPREIIENLYIRSLSRRPTDKEINTMLKIMDEPKTREGYEDVLWGILNSTEFAFNH